MRVALRSLLVLGGALLAGCVSIFVGQADATSLTWSGDTTGRTESAARWSAATNWVEAISPVPSEVLETLTFPQLTNNQCTSAPPTDTCYATFNDVEGLTADTMQLDDYNNYQLFGDKISLGEGGIVAKPPNGAAGSGSALVALPLELSASQKWSIAEQGTTGIEENGLVIGDEVTGAGKALTVELSNGPVLILGNNTEVGPVALDGPRSGGEHIENGSVLLEDGELNSTDGESVALRNIYFTGAGAVGALSTDNATLEVGSRTYPAGSLDTSRVTFDPASGVLFEIQGGKTEAGVDYSQLVSTGAVELGGQIGIFVDEPSPKAGCPVLQRGSQYTFISTSGPLYGVFSNAPERSNEELPIDFAKSCGQRSQTMRITYSNTGSVNTVTGTVEAAEFEHENSQESLKKEAERFTIAVEAERAAQKRQEEEALAALSKKMLDEEAVAIAKRQREEEMEAEVATGRLEVSLVGSTIKVPKSGVPSVELKCRGTSTCAGKLTLTIRRMVRRGGKTRHETIGAAVFSINGGVTMTVKLALNAKGRALVRAAREPLRATLMILQSAPGPRRTHSQGVLVMPRAAARALDRCEVMGRCASASLLAMFLTGEWPWRPIWW